jgi:hypothetical protein
MPKWEYMTAQIHDNRLGAVNEQQVKDSTKPFASDYLNQLGEQGWELVATSSSNYVHTYTVILKRPMLQQARKSVSAHSPASPRT